MSFKSKLQILKENEMMREEIQILKMQNNRPKPSEKYIYTPLLTKVITKFRDSWIQKLG